MREEEFFAPRPKVPWELRLFRVSAFLAAAGISFIFMLLDWQVITGPQQLMTAPVGPSSPAEKLLCIIVLTLIQIVLILPCWRAWLFIRGACYYVLMVWLGLSLFGFQIIGFGSSYAASFFLLVSVLFLYLQLLLLTNKGHRLKPGI